MAQHEGMTALAHIRECRMCQYRVAAVLRDEGVPVSSIIRKSKGAKINV
mgnify:CR=1 FL=1